MSYLQPSAQVHWGALSNNNVLSRAANFWNLAQEEEYSGSVDML